MADHERAMLSYVRLADVSQRKQQVLGRDKFLVLAGAAACRSGWADVARHSRGLVLANNPSHLIGRFETFADALRSPDFESYLKQLERFCSYEKAEHLLRELDIVPGLAEESADTNSGQAALEILSQPHWGERSHGSGQ